MPSPEGDCDDCSYRRSQFILGPAFPRGYPNWNRIIIGDGLRLCTHPDLEVTSVSGPAGRVVCLGYMLNPDQPEETSHDIVDRLAAVAGSRAALLDSTSRLGGRWVLIVQDKHESYLLNDATGLREVYFTTRRHASGVWCASQPQVIAELFGFQVSGPAAEFLRTLHEANHRQRKQRVRWWPGDGSPYCEIEHLLPNHYLSLSTGRVQRFWPIRECRKMALAAAVEEASQILRGTMASAAKRFDNDLVLMITGGMDSRVVLAASREIAGRLSYVTLAHNDNSDIDASNAAGILGELGLPHTIVPAHNTRLTDEFRAAYSRQCLALGEHTVANAQALLPYFQRSRVAVLGSVAEVAVNPYYLEVVRPFIPATSHTGNGLRPDLAKIKEMEHSPYAERALQEWLDLVGNTHGYHVFDLFYWEQRVGNWLADWLLGYDLIWKDSVVPFNCRRLLEILLWVDASYRKKYDSRIHERLIERLWPAVPTSSYSKTHDAEEVRPTAKPGINPFRRVLASSLNF